MSEAPGTRLKGRLRYLVAEMFQSSSNNEEETLKENRTLLQSLTVHIMKDISGVPEQVPFSILGWADTGRGKGHMTLFPVAMEWLQAVKQFIVQNAVKRLENGFSTGKPTVTVDNFSHFLNYISNIIIALKYGSDGELL